MNSAPSRPPTSLQRIARALEQHDKFFLLLHQNPDGDSIGSSLALALLLRQMGKSAEVGYVDYMPETFMYLPGADSISCWSDLETDGAVALLCDCSNLSRVGDAQALVEAAPMVLNVDHHPDNPRFGDLAHVDPTAAATAELVFELLLELQGCLTLEVAESLYVGLLTDTGRFCYDNTTARTHRVTAELLNAGVKPNHVMQQVYENRPVGALRLLATGLSSIKQDDLVPVAWAVLSLEDIEKAGARPEDAEPIVTHVRSLRGVEVAFLAREEEKGLVKVSLRSQRYVDVSEIAARLGGGGHARAAGCRVEGVGLSEAVDHVLAVIRECMAGREGVTHGVS